MTDRTVPPEVTSDIRTLVADAGITDDVELISRILITGVGLGLDETSRLDLKITSAALSEMRAAFRLFAPYRGVPKVTVFGSARTRHDDPLYRAATASYHGLLELHVAIHYCGCSGGVAAPPRTAVAASPLAQSGRAPETAH